LPAELRNHIYNYACSGFGISLAGYITPAGTKYYLLGTFSEDHTYHDLGSLYGIILACRQLYNETRILLFELNAFYVYSVSSIPYQTEVLNETCCSAITEVHIDFDLLFYGYPDYNGAVNLVKSFTRFKKVVIVDCPTFYQEMAMVITKCAGGGCSLPVQLEKLYRDFGARALRFRDFESMVSQLLLNLGWMGLELVHVSVLST
jgi:hypothetical protein